MSEALGVVENFPAVFYFLKDGRVEPEIISYPNVGSEGQLESMLIAGIVVCNEDGVCPDKIFAYWNGVWYHAVPSGKVIGGDV